MTLAEQLKERFNKDYTQTFATIIGDEKTSFEELYSLISNEDNIVAWRAAWVCVTICKRHKEWFIPLRNEMIKRVVCPDTYHGVRHQILCILLLLPEDEPINVALLDYCLEHMIHPDTSIAIQALSVKLAYRMCQQEPALMREFDMIIDDGMQYVTAPAIRCTIKNVRKKRHKET